VKAAATSKISSLSYRDFSLVIGGPFNRLLRRVGLGLRTSRTFDGELPSSPLSHGFRC